VGVNSDHDSRGRIEKKIEIPIYRFFGIFLRYSLFFYIWNTDFDRYLEIPRYSVSVSVNNPGLIMT